MSGIAGILNFHGAPVEPGLLEQMTAAMAYRGPDGIHHWSNRSLALGYCALHTADTLIATNQPLFSESNSHVLVFDGRIDNRNELKQRLRNHGKMLRDISDADLVLAAYRRWGEASPEYLLGDFAYVVWDAQSQSLFCARDHLGVKPLYYFQGTNFFAFASEEEVFLTLSEVAWEPNEDRIAYFLTSSFDHFNFNESWLKDVFKLEPGQSMTVATDGKVTVNTYWQLEPLSEIHLASDREYEEAFHSIFQEAVSCRISATADPAVLLSGGIDSASVASAAWNIEAAVNNLDVHSYSVVSEESMTSRETQNITSIISGHERSSHMLSIDGPRDRISDQDLSDVAWSRAHPVDNSILLPALMYQAANRMGSKVMLDGIEGDLVAWSPLWYPSSLIRAGYWGQAWAESRQAAINNTYLKEISPYRIYAKSFWDAYAPIWARHFKQWFRPTKSKTGFDSSLINPAFAEKLQLRKRIQASQSASLDRSRQSDQKAHIHVLTQPGIMRGMEGFDRVAARYGIESRHPWSDKRLIEFFLRLPMQQKVGKGWTKYLLRRVMAPRLGENVCWNSRKEHLGWQLTRRLLANDFDQIVKKIRECHHMVSEYMAMDQVQEIMKKPFQQCSFAELSQLYDAAILAYWLSRIRLGGKVGAIK